MSKQQPPEPPTPPRMTVTYHGEPSPTAIVAALKQITAKRKARDGEQAEATEE